MEQVSFKNKKPTLFLVSTPIGNLDDITYRAVYTLKSVNICFAEDTRTTGILFKHYDIKTKLASYHEHQKYEKINEVLNYLENGEDVALVSDAGTPGISDPGFELVGEVIKAGFYVVSIPGAVAGITALTSSGLQMQPHLFLGFLPRKESEIVSLLENYQDLNVTLIIYESPHRVSKTISYLHEVFGNKKIVIARELTKIYETFIRTSLDEAINIEYNNKGEYVLIIENEVIVNTNKTIEELYQEYKDKYLDEKELFKVIATRLNISKKEVYRKLKIDNKASCNNK
ncbi:MAG: 16S rRNA (cytidine(1402)-2'-O)-methyltransferase [Acholeplasma sp.]|nr:16S rRNA (cytidine(1402)-2'-O)-methyltransferase [Acholeplasma sp.]